MALPFSNRLAGPFTLTAGQTGPLPADWPLFAAPDVSVQRLRAGTVSELVLGVDYSLSGVGGTTFSASLLAGAEDGDEIVLIGDRVAARDSTLVSERASTPALLNKDLDIVYAQLQEFQRKVDAALTVGVFGGDFDARGLRITNIADATEAQDAVSYSQMMEAVGLGGGGLDISGLDPIGPIDPNGDFLAIHDESLEKLCNVTPALLSPALTYTAAFAGAGQRTLWTKLGDVVSLLDFQGADPTGATSSTAALQAALNTGRSVYVPQGSYLLTNMVTVGQFQTVYGDGKGRSVFLIDAATFNMAATCVFSVGRNATFREMGVSCAQPDTTSRASMHQYPPIFRYPGQPRVTFEAVRISGAWDGVLATGNTGGGRFNSFECGAINCGIEFNDPLDFIHIEGAHFWPFGFEDANRLQAWLDGNTVATKLNSIDGLEVTGYSTYGCRTETTDSFGTMSSVNLDGARSCILMAGGHLEIASLYKTAGTVAGAYAVKQSGGTLRVTGYEITMAASANDAAVQITGANTAAVWTAGIVRLAPADQPVFDINSASATLILGDTYFPFGTNTVRTVPFVRQQAGRLTMTGCRFRDRGGSGSGAAVTLADDNWHVISGNAFLDWDVGAPPTTATCYLSGNSGSHGSANAGRIRTGNGADTSPAYSFQSDTDTGVYRVSSDVLGLTTGGVGRARVDNVALAPVTADALALGSASLPWADADFASGAVLRFANADTLTHASGLFSFSTPVVVGVPSAGSHAATKDYVDGIIAAQDAMVFKGVIDCSANPNYPAADRGWTYRVSVAGKIGGGSGVNVEAGDILLCLTDGTASGAHGTVGSAWNVIQANLDGAVIGPASAVSGRIAIFSGTSGKLLADGGLALPASTLVGLTDAQTLTNKSLTTPTITGAPTAAGATWADLGSITTADINGGTIDNTVIGGATPAVGTFSALNMPASSVLTIGDVTLTHSTGLLTQAGSLTASGSIRGAMLRASGDTTGVGGTNSLTSVSDMTANSSGVGSIKFKGATSRDTVGFIKIYYGTTAGYVPVFSAITG